MVKIYTFTFLLLLGSIAFGQNINWSNYTGSVKSDQNYGVQKSDNMYIMPVFYLDSFYTLNKWNYVNKTIGGTYLNFYNSSGKLTKNVKLKNDSFRLNRITEIYNGRMSSHFSLILNNVVIKGKKYDPNIENYLFEVDTNGNIEFNLKVTAKANNNPIKPLMSLRCNKRIDSDIYAVLNLGGSNRTYYLNDSEDSVTNGSVASVILVRINKFKKISIIRKFPYSIILDQIVKTEDKNKFYLSATIQDLKDTFIMNSKKYYYEPHNNVLVFTLDSFLNIIDILRLPGSVLSVGCPINVVSKSSYFIPITISNPSKSTTIIIKGDTIQLIDNSNIFLLYVSNNRIKYYKQFKKLYDDKTSSSVGELSSYSSGEYCVVTGLTANPTIILPDSIVINAKINDADFLALKLDTFGNILWYYNFGKSGSTERALNALYDSTGIIVCGTFDSTTTLGNFTITSNGGTDALIFKITDNAIYRGDIAKGPYCAGDSIRVPYRAYGKYHDTNTFYAELSDENGNFYGTPRILGKYKSNAQNGIIKGVLPLFDVVSSGNYRIRIRSNSPFVQSFMRYDSLKLRIYSKDKALPGPDTTVCFGVPVQLSAKGGSLWKWTPGAVLNDSTSRTPLFIAKKTTKFRIAISDSSGCGMPDTAFKTVYVLPAPVVVAKDTIVCRGDEFYLNATTFGGKTDSMHTFWYLDTVFLGRDTVKVKTYANARYTVIAKDGCSQANDTAGLVAKLPLAPIILTEDTAVCKGLPFKWSGSGLGYKNRKLKFTWYKNNQLFATDSLFVTPDSSSTFMLQADDACATEIAAKNVTLHVLPDPKLLAQTDSICAHNNHSINFYPTQGRAPYEFYLEGKEVFNGLKIKGDSFKRVVFEVVDACKRKAFDTLELGKIPDISITAEPNQGCIPLQTKLKAVPTKFENYWIFPNSQKVIGNSDPIIVEHKTTGNFNYKYVVKNGICADSSDLIISVYPSPTAAFQINGKNLLIGDANTRIVNYSTGANRFVWNWLNQQRYDSTITSFQLQFSDTGKFEISLIAENNYGCKDTANDFVFVHPKPIIWMPNGISLNGDGLNEKLEPGGIGIKDYKLMVINKWGEIIFNGEENEPWYPKSETLPGVYVYRCVYSNWKGLKFEENGTVLLIK